MLWVSSCHVQIMWIICDQVHSPFGGELLIYRVFFPASSILKLAIVFANKNCLKIWKNVASRFQDTLKTNGEQIIFIYTSSS